MKITNGSKTNQLSLSIDYRLIIAVLLLIIITMFALWRPWDDPRGKDRSVEVTGQASVKATPDEFVFYPSYQFKNADKQAGLAELTKKSNEVVAGLKKVGVADNKIKTSSDGNAYPIYGEDDKTPTYTLSLVVTVSKQELAQKVQDYLVSTTPLGAVSPQSSFSTELRNKLESQARDKATKDARAKADQSAKNLGFTVGAVKSVKDGTGFGGDIPFARGGVALDTQVAQEKLSIQPGENELNYTVTVTYFVK